VFKVKIEADDGMVTFKARLACRSEGILATVRIGL
jgi:hypothetical protein